MYCLKSHVKFIGYWKHVPIEIPKTYFSLPKRMLKWPKITMSQYRSLPWRGQTEWKMLTSSTQKYLATHEIDIQRFAQLMDCDLLTVCSLPVKPYICFRSSPRIHIVFSIKILRNDKIKWMQLQMYLLSDTPAHSHPFHLQNPTPRGGWFELAAAVSNPESISPRSNLNSFSRASIFCSRSWISETSSCQLGKRGSCHCYHNTKVGTSTWRWHK